MQDFRQDLEASDMECGCCGEEKTDPDGPCKCGSGKKYKDCCMECECGSGKSAAECCKE